MNCENCERIHEGQYASGRFCSKQCSRAFSTKAKRKEINALVSQALKGKTFEGRSEIASEHWKKYWETEHAEHRKKLKDSQRKNINKRKRGHNPEKKCIRCQLSGTVSYYGKYCETCKKNYLSMYRWQASFRFNVYDYPTYFDLSLIEKYGWYSAKNRGNNLEGVSRDHLYSVHEGFTCGIDAKILCHPANCKIILNKENQSKKHKSSITLEELKKRIENFTRTYGRVA